jgi:hypothetical protein
MVVIKKPGNRMGQRWVPQVANQGTIEDKAGVIPLVNGLR